MLLRCKLFGKTYEFRDLRELMGKANEDKSGDHLAGVAASSALERVAAKYVLSQVPLSVLYDNPVVPYEQDEVTRVIMDALDQNAYAQIKGWTVGQLREWILDNKTTNDEIKKFKTA